MSMVFVVMPVAVAHASRETALLARLQRFAVVTVTLGLVACVPRISQVTLPRPLTVSVDDCGWQNGASLADTGGPWRLGARDPNLEDYRRLARIARAAKTRLLTAWVMSELDRSNICARPEYNRPVAPSDLTEPGLDWDNHAGQSGESAVVMDLLHQESAWLEFGLHGVRHEHWEDGRRTRAEFGSRDGRGWSVEDNLVHLRAFAELLRQYYSIEENPFPVSFIPPDHGYRIAPGAPVSSGVALQKFGVRFVQLPGPMRIDHGILILGRDTDASPPYDSIGRLPGRVSTDASFVMTHLPNFYSAEAEWIAWLRSIDASMDRVLPRNTAQAASQVVYATYARLRRASGAWLLDTTGIPDELYRLSELGPVLLKVASGSDGRASVAVDGGAQVVASYPDGQGHTVIAVADASQPQGRLRRSVFRVFVDHDHDQLNDHIELDGTYQIFGIRRQARDVAMALEMYGRQEVTIVLPEGEPSSVQTDNPRLLLGPWTWSGRSRLLRIPTSATNMQGERATIVVGMGQGGSP